MQILKLKHMSTINNQQVHLLPFLFPFGLVFQNKPLHKQEQVWPKAPMSAFSNFSFLYISTQCTMGN